VPRSKKEMESLQTCCIEDEDRPLGTALQEEVLNHPMRQRLRADVVSDRGKVGERNRQVSQREMNESEPLMKCRYLRTSDVETGVLGIPRDKSGRNLLTGQTASGVEMA